MDGRAKTGESRKMLWHAVTHMPFKTVAGVSQAEPGHEPVARDFRYDRRRRNRHHQRIARYDGFAIATTIDLLVSVDKDQFRLHRQRPDRSGERPERGAQNIIAVNALDRPQRNSDLPGRPDVRVKFLALRGIELLGIIKATRVSGGIENPCSRNDGPGKRPPARLIAAGNGKNPLIQSAALAPECRPQDRLVERQARI